VGIAAYRADAIAITASLAWLGLIWWEWIPTRPLLGSVLLLGAYLLSCFGLILANRSNTTFGRFALVVCGTTAALVAFTTWGTVLSEAPILASGKSPPIGKFLGMLFPPFAAAIATAAVVLVPTSLLFAKHYWLVPIAALVIGIYVSGYWPLLPAEPTTGDSIVAIAWVLFAALPTFVLVKFGPLIRRRIRAT
jgi:hypothetical protein